MTEFFALDGHDYSALVVDCDMEPVIMDGQGTGRTQAYNLIRDPAGVFYNFTVTFAPRNAEDYEFDMLWDKIMSLGKTEFINLYFKRGRYFSIIQNVYANPKSQKLKHVRGNDEFIWGTWQVFFGAEDLFV